MKIEICNRWSGSIQYECDLDVAFDIAAPSFRLGAAVELAYRSGADLSGKKLIDLRVFAGLYAYQVWAILFDDKSRWVRMGCLFHSLDEWEKIGIRKSNLTEFPDDGSAKCEERVAAFEFAKAAALRMKAGGR
jgi:hypothetical protein